MNIQDQIDDAVKKQQQWGGSPQSHRDFIESLIVGRVANINRRGVKIYWVKQGILYLPFTSYKIK